MTSFQRSQNLSLGVSRRAGVVYRLQAERIDVIYSDMTESMGQVGYRLLSK